MAAKFSRPIQKYIRTGIVVLVAALLAVYVYKNWGVMLKSLEALSQTSPVFLLVGVALTALTFVFAARAYTSLALKKLRFTELLIIEFAATAINRILPSGLGGMGAHGVYLFKRGHNKTAATLVVSTNTLLGFMAHNFLLLVALLIAPQALNDFALPNINGFALLAGLVIALMALWYARKRGAFSAIKTNVHRTVAAYKREPVKIAVATLSLMAVTLTNFTIFMLACSALDISIPLVGGFLVYSLGVLVGAATPTPGGLAGVEAGLVAGLLVMNANEVSAIAAVLAFRFVTFWLPVVPGVFALAYARKKRLL